MYYIEVVGLDGAGKSKLCRSLIYKLGDQARLLHVPSKGMLTTPVVRYVSRESVSPETRLLTYMAGYSEAYDQIVCQSEPFKYLIGDRGYACFYAYQFECYIEDIDTLWSFAMRGTFPDLLVFLDTPVSMCRSRVSGRRYRSEVDKRSKSFYKSVRKRYLSFCASYRRRGQVLILDGRRHRHIQIRKALQAIKRLSRSNDDTVPSSVPPNFL